MKKNRIALASSLAVLLTIFAILFTGCSGSGSGSSTGTPFSQTLNPDEGVRIWYECQNKVEEETAEDTDLTNLFSSKEEKISEPVVYGRETKVIWVKVYKDGKVTSYSCAENIYLGYFAKMTDEEILKELESNPDKYFLGSKGEPYEIYLYTDAAGQEVVFEGIPSQIKTSSDADTMYFMSLISKDTVPTFQVYDSYYGGYILYNYDERPFNQAVLVTRCDQNEAFSIDGLDLEDAIVDYATPEDMLHEKNAELKKVKGDAKKTDKEAEGEVDAEQEAGAEGEAADKDA